MTEKFRSSTITKVVARRPSGRIRRAIGHGTPVLENPTAATASGPSTMTRGTAATRPLAAAAAPAPRRAGAMPQMFGTITVTDGISMGTEGMKYSLVSREAIADAIETAAQSQFMDGVLAIGGPDKKLPRPRTGSMRMNHPRDLVYHHA